MVEPVEAIRAIHNAFRNDLEHIDAAALDSARGKGPLAGARQRSEECSRNPASSSTITQLIT
jgi:hypothetical protein